jgi:hypothetical protein
VIPRAPTRKREALSDDATLFDWDSGFVDDVDFTIESASFTYNSKMGEDLVIKLTGTTKDADGATDPEFEQFYKCGSGFEAFDGGTRARREDGRDKLFNARSGIVEFINAAVAAGVTKEMIVKGGGPASTAWLVGLTFHMKQKEFKGKFDGEEKTWFKLLPTKLLTSSAASTKATKPAPAAAPAESPSAEGVPAALVAKLRKLASESADYDAFVDAAFSGDLSGEVSGNQAAEALVLDADFFNGAK